jgi:hypothetical protein
LAASLGLHAMVLLMRSRIADSRIAPPPTAANAIDVEIVETHPAAASAPPSPVPFQPTSSRRRREASSKQALGAPPLLAAKVLEEAAAVADVPRAAPQARGIPVRVPAPEVVAANVVGRPPTPSPEPEGVDGRVRDFAEEATGQNRVESGLAHHYFADLGRQLIKVWDADRAVSEHGLRGFVDQAGANVQLATKIWLNRAAAYGTSGSPIAGEVTTPVSNRTLAAAEPTNPLAGQGATSTLMAKEAVRQVMAEQFKTSRRAILRVIQRPSGELIAVELVRPSNDVTVDHEALADVRAAAEGLPAPPPEAVTGKERLVSLWQFELIISISPPVPTFTFEFDEALKFIDTRLPLDRRIYKRVRLIAVE